MRWPREWGDQTSFENIEESEICVAILMTFRSSSPQIAFCRRDALLLHCKCHSLDEFGRRNSMRKKMRRQNKMEITNWVICHRMIARGLNEPIYRFRSQPKARKTISSQNEWKKRMINFVRRKHILNDRILSITFSHKTKCKKAKTKRSLLVRRQFAISKLLFFFFLMLLLNKCALRGMQFHTKKNDISSCLVQSISLNECLRAFILMASCQRTEGSTPNRMHERERRQKSSEIKTHQQWNSNYAFDACEKWSKEKNMKKKSCALTMQTTWLYRKYW